MLAKLKKNYFASIFLAYFILCKNNVINSNPVLIGFFFYLKVVLPNVGLELWPGYATSIRQHDGGTMMCTEITWKVLRDETALDIIKQLHSQYGANYEHPLRDEILGVVVMTGYNNRTYRVDDVDFNSTPLSSFQMKDGSSITFMEYYQTVMIDFTYN